MLKKFVATIFFAVFMTTSVFASSDIVKVDNEIVITTERTEELSNYEKSMMEYKGIVPTRTEALSYTVKPYNKDKLYIGKEDKEYTFSHTDSVSVFYKPSSSLSGNDAKVCDIIWFTKDEYKAFNIKNIAKDPKQCKIINDGGNVIVILPNTDYVPPLYSEYDKSEYKKFLSQYEKNVVPYEINEEGGYINGINYDYTFNFPEGTDFYVFNDIFNDNTNAIEKLSFVPVTKYPKSKDSVVMEMSIHNKNDFEKVIGQIKIAEYGKVVYSIKLNSTNNFQTMNAKEIYSATYDILTENLFKNVKEGLVLDNQIKDDNTTEPDKTGVNVPKEVEQDKQKPETKDEGFSVMINGEKFDTDVVSKGETYYLPIRPILEHLGYTVSWEAQTSSIVATKGKDVTKFKINSTSYVHNGKEIKLEYAPMKISETSYIPIEAIGGLLPYHYFVLGDTIYIKSK